MEKKLDTYCFVYWEGRLIRQQENLTLVEAATRIGTTIVFWHVLMVSSIVFLLVFAFFKAALLMAVIYLTPVMYYIFERERLRRTVMAQIMGQAYTFRGKKRDA